MPPYFLVLKDAPHHQVQQRGVQGTKEILQKILDGVDFPADSQVFVVDLTLNRLPMLIFTFIGHPNQSNLNLAGGMSGAVVFGSYRWNG
jgi:hypothetical protein